MSGEPDDEDLDRLLDADTLPEASADTLTALLRAAATPDPGRALRGEETATAAYRTAFTPQPPTSTPRRTPIQHTRTRRGMSAALLGVTLLILATLALTRLPGHDPHNSPTLTASTAPLTPPPPGPNRSHTTPRQLNDNATLTPATQNSPSTSVRTPPAPDLKSGQAHNAKTASPSAHPRTHHAHTSRNVAAGSGRAQHGGRSTRRRRLSE